MNDIFDELVSSNYWNGKLPKVEFARKSYTNRIFGYVGNRLVKVLTGQRGVGKGCLLRQIIYQLIADGVSSRNILYISKKFTDSGVLSGYRDLDDLLFIYREKIHPVGKVYIFIEEIQKVEGWEHFVHSHSQDFVDTCELFISGSNQDMLSGEAEKLLARHYVSFEIFPFSFSEHRILERVEATGKNYAEYMGKGALPILFNLPDAEAGWKAISALRDTILFRDIIRRYRIKDARLLEDVFVYLCTHLAELITIGQLVSHFTTQNRKTSYDTVANYICYLEDTSLIHRVERYQIRSKEILLGSCKYYINDWAFMRHLYPFFAGSRKSCFENQVYLELRRAGYTVFVGVLRGGRLVDFVGRKKDRIVYLQCAPLLNDDFQVEQMYNTLEMIQDNYEKWVVSMDDTTLPSKEGIRHIQVWQLPEIL